MPLIIGVLIIIVICVVFNDKEKEHNLREANFAEDKRKTNAVLEHDFISKYIQNGLSIEDAVAKGKNDLIERGFEPCMPSDLYERYCDMFTGTSGLDLIRPEKYDSRVVKNRKEILRQRDIPLTDENIYNHLPETYDEYELELKKATLGYESVGKGKMFTHPRYGTCEVIGYRYNLNGTKGCYIAKQVMTGEIIENIRIGDPQIRMLRS